MSLSETVRKYVQSQVIQPARDQGAPEISISAGEVHRSLKWTSRVPAVCAALNSRKFQRAAGLELIEKSGPPSGQSTTMVFRYRVLAAPTIGEAFTSPSMSDSTGGLGALYGICEEMYREVGGGEAFIRAQRENFGSIVPDMPAHPEENSR